MKNIVIGVIDKPYGLKAGEKGSSVVTTGMVAQFVENKYDLFANFALKRQDFIAKEIVNSIVGSINSINAGRDPSSGYLKSACSNIQKQFKSDIYQQVVESWGMKGVPTKAALMGISRRYKSGLNGVTMNDVKRAAKKNQKITQGQRRPSFVDTGIFANSIKVWDE